MDSPLRIARETEFYQGYIRFKMSVSNESPYVINDITIEFIYDDILLHIADHSNIPVKNGKFLLDDIYGGKSKTLTILFEPLTCTKAADIKCHLMYTDHEGKMGSTFMEPKEISVVCPIMKTDQDINVGRLKEFIKFLPNSDSRVYDVQNGFDIKQLASIARKVVEKHDVRHIRTLHTRDGRTCEIWYYGRTKVSKDDIVIKISLLTESHTIELFAATHSAETLTGLLAEVGRYLQKTIESRGSGRVVNIHIKDSVVQRSNLLDMCYIDENCDINIVIEDSVVQRSNIAHVDEEVRRRQEQEKLEQRLRKDEEERKALEAIKIKASEGQNPTPDKTAYTSTKNQVPSSQKRSGKKKVLVPMFVLLLLGGVWMGLIGDTNDQGTVSLQNLIDTDDELSVSSHNTGLDTNSLDTSEIPYWIEGVDSSDTTFIKIDELAPVDTQTYAVEKVAGYEPNAAYVFDEYWGFEDGTLQGFATQASSIIQSSTVKRGSYAVSLNDSSTSASQSGAISRSFSYQSGVIEFDLKRVPSSTVFMHMGLGGSSEVFSHIVMRSTEQIKHYNGGWVDYSGGTVVASPDWQKHSVAFDRTNDIMKFALNNVDHGNGARINDVDITTLLFSSGTSAGTGQYAYIDDIRLRKYATTEPIVLVEDMETWYKVTVTNNDDETLTDYQVSIPSADLDISSTEESLYITRMSNSQSSVVEIDDFGTNDDIDSTNAGSYGYTWYSPDTNNWEDDHFYMGSVPSRSDSYIMKDLGGVVDYNRVELKVLWGGFTSGIPADVDALVEDSWITIGTITSNENGVYTFEMPNGASKIRVIKEPSHNNALEIHYLKFT